MPHQAEQYVPKYGFLRVDVLEKYRTICVLMYLRVRSKRRFAWRVSRSSTTRESSTRSRKAVSGLKASCGRWGWISDDSPSICNVQIARSPFLICIPDRRCFSQTKFFSNISESGLRKAPDLVCTCCPYSNICGTTGIYYPHYCCWHGQYHMIVSYQFQHPAYAKP